MHSGVTVHNAPPAHDRDRRRVLLGEVSRAAAVAGPVVFTAGWIVGGWLTPGYSHVRDAISQIAAAGAPYAVLQQAGFVVLALSIALLALGLGTSQDGRHGLVIGLLAVAATAGVLTAFAQDDPTGTVPQSLSGAVHRATGGVFFLAMIGAAFALKRALTRPWHARLARFSLASGVASLALFVLYGALVSNQHSWSGLAQRGLALSLMAWIGVVGLTLPLTARARPPRSAAR